MYRSINPATETLFAEFPTVEDNELNKIIEKSNTAYHHWKKLTTQERSNALYNLACALKNKREEAATLISQEMGKPIKEAITEIEKCIETTLFYSNNAQELINSWHRSEIIGNNKAYLTLEPLGSILGIMPWNFPFWQVFRFAIPTLITGNTVIIKHSPNTPSCAMFIENLFKEIDTVQDIYCNAYLTNQQVEKLLADNRIKGVSLTGSVKAGRSVGQIAGKYIKPSVLELGGSDPLIVSPSADIEKATDIAVKAKFLNNGQVCIASKRILIANNLFNSFASLFIDKIKKLNYGDPLNQNTDLGPMARKDLQENLASQKRELINNGATTLYKREMLTKQGFYYPATVLDINSLDKEYKKISSMEIFGPVALLLKFNNIKEAINIANSVDYGLSSIVITEDQKEKELFIKQLEAGSVFINSLSRSHYLLPFGGSKLSGYGRELGKESLIYFSNLKLIWE